MKLNQLKIMIRTLQLKIIAKKNTPSSLLQKAEQQWQELGTDSEQRMESLCHVQFPETKF